MQPEHVEAFAAEGNQDTSVGFGIGCRPMFLKVGIDFILMKAGAVAVPAFVPEVWVHDLSCRRGDLCDRPGF